MEDPYPSWGCLGLPSEDDEPLAPRPEARVRPAAKRCSREVLPPKMAVTADAAAEGDEEDDDEEEEVVAEVAPTKV